MGDMAADEWGTLAALMAAAEADDEHEDEGPHPCCGPTRRQLLAWTGAWSAFAAAGLWSPQAVAAAEAAAPALSSAAAPDDAISQGMWLSGDTHVHTDHSSDGSAPRQANSDQAPGNVSVADQIGQGLRTGLSWMPLTDHRTYDQHWDPLWSSPDLLLIPGEEANGRPHATVLGAVDEVVDGADTAPSHRRLQQNIWDARAQAASWGVAHPDDGELDNGVPNAFAMAVGMHTVEAWNKGSNTDLEIDYCENRWNAGWRFGVVGAGDNHFRELWAIAGPGSPTTWVHAAERSERGILDALRAGRTAVSTSPLSAFVTLEADLDGDGTYEAIGGDGVSGLTAGRTVQLRVRVQRGVGHQVQVLQAPGRGAARLATFTVASLDQTWIVPAVVPTGEGWWRVEVRGAGAPASIDPKKVLAELQAGMFDPPTLTDQLQTLCSPIFTSTGGPAVPRPDPAIGTAAPSQDGATDAVEAASAFDESGVFFGFPDVAADTAAGGVHVVAERHGRAATSVVHRRVGADGSAGPVTVLSGDATTARLPRLGAAGLRVWAVWQEEQTGQLPRKADIVARTSVDGGATWQAPIRISAGGSIARDERPAIALDPSDPSRPLVVWTGNPTDAFDVFAAHVGVDTVPRNLSGAGKVLAAANPVDTRSARYPASLHPAVTVGADGTQAVVWQDDRFDADPLWSGQNGAPDDTQGPDSWEPMVSTRAPGGLWTAPVRVAPDPDRTHSARHPQIGFDGAHVVVVWTTKDRRSRAATWCSCGPAPPPAPPGAWRRRSTPRPRRWRSGPAWATTPTVHFAWSGPIRAVRTGAGTCAAPVSTPAPGWSPSRCREWATARSRRSTAATWCSRPTASRGPSTTLPRACSSFRWPSTRRRP
jgi:hypothetical protein